MDLWIRNQSRRRLIKLNTVFADGNQIWCDNRCWLGDYNTEERALEVLDEIQKLLIPQVCELAEKIANNEYNDYNKLTNVYAIMDDTGTVNVSEISTVIYEMPKE